MATKSRITPFGTAHRRIVLNVFVVSVILNAIAIWNASDSYVLVNAQENPCQMEIFAFYDLTTCTQSITDVAARAIVVADGQCRTASTNTLTSDPDYTLLPGNYRAQCINSTAVQFIESGCITNQCNATSLLDSATCDRNNSIASSLYSRLEPPEYITNPGVDQQYTCFQANGSNVTVSFAIFGDCSSPTCTVPQPTPAPIAITNTTAPVTTSVPTTPAPAVTAPSVTAPSPTIIITPPSSITTSPPTKFPNENPTLAPAENVSPTTTAPVIVSNPTNSPLADAPTPTTGSAPSIDSGVGVPPTVPVENKSSNASTMIAGIASGVALVAVLLALLLFYRRRKNSQDDLNSESKIMNGDNEGFGGSNRSTDQHHTSMVGSNTQAYNNNNNTNTNDDNTAAQYANTTNEIWVDPDADEVSTLGGGTLPNDFVFGAQGTDEPTASVNLDYDFNRNQYRTDETVDNRTQSHFTASTNPTAFTNFSKLGLLGEAEFADDVSFEEQFAELDDTNDIRSRYNNGKQPSSPSAGANISNRVRPFEVRAPPGKLGMVVDTPNGGVPVVRAIKADSVLNGSVQIGDRLISVDHINVTSMSALEVSNLISLKQHQQRLLIFCRLTTPS